MKMSSYMKREFQENVINFTAINVEMSGVCTNKGKVNKGRFF